ncbi:MAG: AAA family ATPase [bacterium]
MSKIILALVGQIASGKDTVAEYIVTKYGGVSLSFSQPLRDILNRTFLSINRTNMSWLGQTLVDRFGVDTISKIIGKEIEASDKKIFVLPNIRREGDVAYFKDWPGYILVGVKTDPKICYERLIKRNQNTDDQAKTWEEFQKDLQLSTEVAIDDLIKKSSAQIDNNGTLEDLHKQVDEIIKKLS